LILKQNSASFEELLQFYEKNANLFIPNLNSQVKSLYEYVDKLKKNATFLEAYDNNTLAGLVAIYLNNHETNIAFISSVIVSKEYQGKGISKILLKTAIDTATLRNFQKIKLEVYRSNTKAIKLYKKLGFKESNKDFIFMELSINS